MTLRNETKLKTSRVERTLAKLRIKGLVNGKRSGRALVYESCPSILHVENDR